MRRLLIIAGVAIAAAFPAAAFAADLPVGMTLTNEACTAAPARDASADAGMPVPLTISCGGTAAGGLAYARAPALPVAATAAARATIARRVEDSRLYAVLRQRVLCQAGTWLDGLGADGSAILALPCTTREGGWPHLVLVAPGVDRLAVADGGATMLPALLTLLKSPRAAAPAADQTALLARIWGHPVALIAAGDVARLGAALRTGRTANGLGKYADAEAAFRDALALETGPLKANDEVVAATLLDLALNVSNQGRADEAAALFRRATPMMQASAADVTKARLATYLALNAANAGDIAQGLPLARDAAAGWRKLVAAQQAQAPLDAAGPALPATQEQGELANALNLQALMELRSDNVIQAYSAASEALLILNRSENLPRWWKADSLVVMGEISVAQGRLSAAETYLTAALKLRRQLFGDGAPTIRVLAALARAYQHENMSTSTIVTYREMFKLARALPSTAGVFTADMLVPFASAIVDTADTLTDPLARRGLYAEAFDAFQLVQSPLVDKTVAQAAARLSAQDPAIAGLIGNIQDQEREIAFARLKLAHEQSLPDNERSAQVETEIRSRIAAATAAAAGARQTLAVRYPDYERLTAPAAVNLDQLRAALKPGEGVLSFLVGRERSFAQLVTREGAVVAPVAAGDDAIREAVTALRRPLEVQGGAISEFDLNEANRFHDLLLGGLKRPLAAVDHLVVVPAGPLSNLPFALLVATPPTSQGYERADWLVRSKTIAYTPSLQALSALRATRPRAVPRQALLAFGDPALSGHAAGPSLINAAAGARPSAMALLAGNCRQGGPMPATLLQALAPLPDTAKELGVVAATLGASPQSLFLGANATEANLRKQTLDDYRVLYFATHGLLPGELRCQAEPGLVLTPPAIAGSAALDGLLESSEIASLRLNADLVVLSACNTAAGDNRFGGGDALSGLAEAFFHAGARNMLVTHWQVPSAATSDLMSGLFTTLKAVPGDSVGDALRQAQLGLIARGQTAHPFFWAAFVVIGDGAGLSGDQPGAATIQTAKR